MIEIGSKTAEKNSAQTKRQTDGHYENNGHLAVNQQLERCNLWPRGQSPYLHNPAIVIVMSFAIELATPTIMDVCMDISHLIYKDTYLAIVKNPTITVYYKLELMQFIK